MAEAQLAAVLTSLQGMLQQQQAATTALANQAAAVENKFNQGEVNFQSAMSTSEDRLAATEVKLADALSALSGTMLLFRSGFDRRFAASDSRLDAAMNQLMSTMASSTPVPSASIPSPPGTTSGAAAASVGGGQSSGSAAPPDPWAQAAAAAAAAQADQTSYTAPQTSVAHRILDSGAIRTKDFLHFAV